MKRAGEGPSNSGGRVKMAVPHGLSWEVADSNADCAGVPNRMWTWFRVTVISAGVNDRRGLSPADSHRGAPGSGRLGVGRLLASTDRDPARCISRSRARVRFDDFDQPAKRVGTSLAWFTGFILRRGADNGRTGTISGWRIVLHCAGATVLLNSLDRTV